MTDSDPAIRRADLRYLGRLLGDVIRTQNGADVFDAIEGVRQASVAAHRNPDPAATAALSERLGSLDLADTLSFVRGFLLFSLLANLAEDRGDGTANPEATLADAMTRLDEAGVARDAVVALLAGALIVPVLTAHPTEVRRKSVIDRETTIAELIAQYRAGHCDAGIEAELIRQITILWQTRPLRAVKPTVLDEILGAMSYLGGSFLPVLPRLQRRWEALTGTELPAFLRPGSWIGGDRDGNPNVDAATLEAALAAQARLTLGHYLGEVDAIGAELSMSSAMIGVSPALADLAEASGDTATSRADEPYRRALDALLFVKQPAEVDSLRAAVG